MAPLPALTVLAVLRFSLFRRFAFLLFCRSFNLLTFLFRTFPGALWRTEKDVQPCFTIADVGIGWGLSSLLACASHMFLLRLSTMSGTDFFCTIP